MQLIAFTYYNSDRWNNYIQTLDYVNKLCLFFQEIQRRANFAVVMNIIFSYTVMKDGYNAAMRN